MKAHVPKFHVLKIAAGCAGLLAAVSPLALGQTPPSARPAPIEEVVVTGELRQARLLDSPVSASVVTLDGQRAGTVNHLEEVLGWVPNVNFASGGGRARFVQIRGIGERGQFAEPLNPSVGLVLDGVDLTGIGSPQPCSTCLRWKCCAVLRAPCTAPTRWPA
jgi:iron complex outermembrane recepter protein